MTLPKIAIALALTLVVALIVAKLSPPDDLFRNVALLISFGMCAVLAGSGVIEQFAENTGTAIRHALIWGALISLVTLAYSNRAAFGF